MASPRSVTVKGMSASEVGSDVPNLIKLDEVLPNQTVAGSNLGRQIICA